MRRRKETELGLKHGFIPVTAIFGDLECDWLKNADEWGVFQVQITKPVRSEQNLHRITGLYQFVTRFSFTLDCAFAKWLSDILKELFMVK